MLPKKKRLTRPDFSTFSKGRVVHTPLFSFKYQKTVPTTEKFAVVVSKKVAKTAVARNTVRRRFYNELHKGPLQGFQGVVYVKKEAVTAKSAAIQDALRSAFR